MTLFLVSNALILVDQYTKFLVNTHIPLYYSIKVIDGFFNLTHVRNPGVAFGLFADQDSEYKVLVFILISTVAIFAILLIYYQTPDEKKVVRTGLIMIFSGAIGNLIDRIAYAEVVDFVDIFYGNYHWPAFNFADACITIGVTFMILDLFQGQPEEKGPPAFRSGS
ncbi:Lipoprotein signal peptidase [hydrothermal vent metagenome]|uniref:Lipoprotein signal peptidase n=1 Tax=hydrothermal vent metagenome TaxID=652676 RepID=A0A3B1CPB9_9ZZZZ